MPSRQLNVLWLIDHVCYDGSLHGGGRLFMNLMPRFDAQRVRIFPYFLRASSEVQKLFAAARHPARNLDLDKYDLRSFSRIAQLCDEHHIDVMHLFCYAASTFGRIVGRFKQIPTVIHDFDTQVYFPYPFYLRIADRLLASTTGRAFAASAFCRDYMRDVRAVPSDKLEVLYHAIPTSQLDAGRQLDCAAARQRLGWGDEVVFACITKFGPDRGNETLLQAFADVRRAVPGARLVMVYKPTLYHRVPKEYEALDWARDPKQMVRRVAAIIERLGLTDCVQLVESLEKPELYYAASDALVAPFESVRFSSVNLVEAMAYGRPHVVTDLGEPAELVDRYDSGLKVPPRDAGRLAEAMISLARDPELRTELGMNARRAAGDLTVDAVAARLTRAYEVLAPQAIQPSGQVLGTN
jgi:glycosyltransferase involved in cell wall biosynthesis